jgi:alkaline phosphatase D
LSPNLGIADPVLNDSPHCSFQQHQQHQQRLQFNMNSINKDSDSPSKNRIAFGSCNDQNVQNNLWPVIESRKPAAWIWGGDAIYADHYTPTDWSTFPPTFHTELSCGTPERLEMLYRKQLAVPGYRRLLDQNITVFGTFDGT